jgi:alanine racemase
MTRLTEALISKKNLLHNVKIIKDRVSSAKIIAMLKSNAYGHGLVTIAKMLEGEVAIFAVASIDEALILKEAGITTEIMLIQGIFEKNELELAANYNLHVVFNNHQQLEWLDKSKLLQPIKSWLKINTGMGRLGFETSCVTQVYNKLLNHANTLNPIRIISHFACADNITHPLNKAQIDEFEKIRNKLKTEYSMCNSAAIINFPECHYEFVRPGIMLYGVSPIKNTTGKDFNLKPVMTFKSQIMAINLRCKGSNIGYNGNNILNEDTLIAIIACGYGDGYPLTASNGTPVLINNKECPIIGRVSMDMIAVNITACKEAKIGDHVTLWGENLPLERICENTHNIVWNSLTSIQSRVKSMAIE